MITLYGVTEDGVSVPVQVTDDGRVVAQGLQGAPGQDGQDSEVPGPEGPQGPQGEYGEGDDVNINTAAIADSVKIGDPPSYGYARGAIFNPASNGESYLQLYVNGNQSSYGLSVYDGNLPGNVFGIGNGGSAFFANEKAGFTSDGELYFTSRTTRYKVVVQNNPSGDSVMMCQEYEGSTLELDAPYTVDAD